MTATLPGPVRALNAVGRRTGDFGSLGRLDADEMLRDARRRTGLSDLGPDTGDALHVLVDSLDREARLTTLGRAVLNRMLRTFLAERLQVVEVLRRRPDLAAAPVARPLFVVGYWRTGTTLLHNLLAQADGARPLLGFEGFDPLPPALGRGGPDLRRARYGAVLRGLWYLGPEITKIHSETSAGPTECLLPLIRSFTTLHLPLMAHVPSYERWLWEQDADAFTATYELHRMQLQTLQADGPSRAHASLRSAPTRAHASLRSAPSRAHASLRSARAGYWVLKSPAHLSTLDALLKVYPDAAVVQTHRDPTKVLGSLSSLVAESIGVLAEPPDPQVIGRQVLERTVRTLDRMDQARRVLGDDRILDVQYADLLEDPVAVVRTISERFGYAPVAEGRLRRWLADNPQGKNGTHRYSLEQFGLEPTTVRRLTASYRQRFNVPAER